MSILKETVTIMNEKLEWYPSIHKAMAEAQWTGKPVFLFFCSDACFYCNQMDMVVYKQKALSDLIRNEFLAVRIGTDTPDVFRAYRVNNVPAFIIAGTDGFEYERYSGFIDANGLAAFCLLALGRATMIAMKRTLRNNTWKNLFRPIRKVCMPRKVFFCMVYIAI